MTALVPPWGARRWLGAALRALGLALGLVLATPAHSASISGQSFDDRIQLADTPLQLNGMGLRAVAWLKGYAAGLYLRDKARTPALVLATSGPKRLRLKMMLKVDAKEFIKAFHKGIERNVPAAEQAKLVDRMALFDAAVNQIGTVKKGDVVDLDFVPSVGTQLLLNGAARGTVLPGDDLYAALLNIFIGDKPVDAELKAGLLGGKVAP
ncbi:MAG: hypothetical protein RJA98_1015 [Pseudomonadota bacterium]|jgi:hypothetical protein